MYVYDFVYVYICTSGVGLYNVCLRMCSHTQYKIKLYNNNNDIGGNGSFFNVAGYLIHNLEGNAYSYEGKPCQSPGRMKNSSYYIAPVGIRTHDLPHTATSNMGKVSYYLTHSATAAVKLIDNNNITF